MRERRDERPAGAVPAEETGAEAARTAEAIRRVFDEALREAIPEPAAGEADGEAEGQTPGP